MKRAMPAIILSLVIAIVLLGMALISKDRKPSKVYSQGVDESSNEPTKSGDYVVEY